MSLFDDTDDMTISYFEQPQTSFFDIDQSLDELDVKTAFLDDFTEPYDETASSTKDVDPEDEETSTATYVEQQPVAADDTTNIQPFVQTETVDVDNAAATESVNLGCITFADGEQEAGASGSVGAGSGEPTAPEPNPETPIPNRDEAIRLCNEASSEIAGLFHSTKTKIRKTIETLIEKRVHEGLNTNVSGLVEYLQISAKEKPYVYDIIHAVENEQIVGKTRGTLPVSHSRVLERVASSEDKKKVFEKGLELAGDEQLEADHLEKAVQMLGKSGELPSAKKTRQPAATIESMKNEIEGLNLKPMQIKIIADFFELESDTIIYFSKWGKPNCLAQKKLVLLQILKDACNDPHFMESSDF